MSLMSNDDLKIKLHLCTTNNCKQACELHYMFNETDICILTTLQPELDHNTFKVEACICIANVFLQTPLLSKK